MNVNNPAEVSSKTEVTFDEHENITRVTAPTVGSSNGEYTYFIRGWKKDGNERTQIYVVARLSDWAFLDRAYSKGEKLDVTEISRDVGYCGSYGCTIYEDVGINFSLDELRSLAQKGNFAAKIDGNNGSVVIDIPSSYINGFIQQFESI